MKGKPNGFWGKLSTDPPDRRRPPGEVIAWHPLADHCADVAACHEMLLRETLIGARLARTAGSEALDEGTIQRLSVLAALHDIGKYATAFQVKAGFGGDVDACGHITTAVRTIFGMSSRPLSARIQCR